MRKEEKSKVIQGWVKPAIYSSECPCKGGVGTVGTGPLMAGFGLISSGARFVPCQRVSAKYFEAFHRGRGSKLFRASR